MRYWYHRGLLAWLLWPASVLFGLVVILRRLFMTGIVTAVVVYVAYLLTLHTFIGS